jgi:uncharacterized membrane protein YsdA (DUF1294 family)
MSKGIPESLDELNQTVKIIVPILRICQNVVLYLNMSGTSDLIQFAKRGHSLCISILALASHAENSPSKHMYSTKQTNLVIYSVRNTGFLLAVIIGRHKMKKWPWAYDVTSVGQLSTC